MTAEHNHPPRCCCSTRDVIDGLDGKWHQTGEDDAHPVAQCEAPYCGRICPACPEHGELETPDARECARKAHAKMEDLRQKVANLPTDRTPDMSEQADPDEPALTVECPQCHQPAGRPHTDYCTLAPGKVWDGVLPTTPAPTRLADTGTMFVEVPDR